MDEFNINDLFKREDPEKAIRQLRAYRELMMLYECALREVTTKFEVLRAEFNVRYNRNPVETVKTRIKELPSILGKLKRKGLPLNLDALRENIFDVAGVRVICSFQKDIYSLCEMFLRQDDVRLIRKKDYIQNPKDNGYRSLHLIVEVPIFLTESTEQMRVEVQFRTIAMDFWASLEHTTSYKREIPDAERIASELRDCADEIARLDLRMQAIHEYIGDGGPKGTAGE